MTVTKQQARGLLTPGLLTTHCWSKWVEIDAIGLGLKRGSLWSIKSLKKQWNEGTETRALADETQRKKEEDRPKKKFRIHSNTKLKAEMKCICISLNELQL